ncbi:MAG: hypothetical protein LBU28_07365 [Spirochaetaceae bacterium]|jgi:hypothetical protein|nr:hypothetical protein [Spirochaetaceae bacterium]
MAVQQTIEIPASRRITIEVPPNVPVGKTILTFTPVQEPLTGGNGLKLSWERIKELSKAPEIQALVGALDRKGLAADITMREIREMRPGEKYGV